MQSQHSRRHNEKQEGWEDKTAGRREPSWFQDASTPRLGRLTRDISVDVAIIGGGIAGMTTGYLLAKAGKKVSVIEDGNLASGETGRTTAHITHALDDRYYEIEKYHGKRLDMGKSCVRFKNLDGLPLELVGKAIAGTSIDEFIAQHERTRKSSNLQQ